MPTRRYPARATTLSGLCTALVAAALSSPCPGESFRWVESDGALSLRWGDTEWFAYQFEPKVFEKVPKNDPRRTRSCYIHPVRGLDEEILTDDAPDDHYHHHGIFWAWPHVKIDGAEHSLWEGPDITQKFERWISRRADGHAATLEVENAWYLHGKTKIMTERLAITAHEQSGDERIFDLGLTLTPVDKPITLRGAGGKSYGGVTLRMHVWPRRDGVVTSPEGLRKHVGGGLVSKEDLSNTRLKWAALTTSIPEGPKRSGIAIMVHPDHPDYPPSWLTRSYGALCVGWPGVEEQTLEPEQSVTLRYRFRVYRGEPSVDAMQSAYRQFLLHAEAERGAQEPPSEPCHE